MELGDLVDRIGPVVGLPVVGDVLWAVRLLADGRPILCDAGCRVGKLTPLLNRWLRLNRKIVIWELYTNSTRPVRRFLGRQTVLGANIVVVYSAKQAAAFARHLDVSIDRFIALPYKSWASEHSTFMEVEGNFIFSGGDSRRDYRTLFDAVRGTGISTIVAARRDATDCDLPPEVTFVRAEPPHFHRLMATCRFVVICMKQNLVRGAGEGTICDAMWLGKPVIVADDLTAQEHVVEGVTGYVVPAGNVQALRAHILELWASPETSKTIGRQAHQHVADNLTQRQFIQRLVDCARRIAAGVRPQRDDVIPAINVKGISDVAHGRNELHSNDSDILPTHISGGH
jgi:hypothetical protein